MPRRDGEPSVTRCCQISVPVSDSSATTRLAAGTYMTPFRTIGVACELVLARAYVHARVRLATFAAVICVSGEYPVPPRSRRYIGQSAPGFGAVRCWVLENPTEALENPTEV